MLAGHDSSVQLCPAPEGLPREVRRKFPHLAALPVLRLPAEAAQRGALVEQLRAQCVVAASNGGSLLAATGAAPLHTRFATRACKPCVHPTLYQPPQPSRDGKNLM